MLTNHDDRNRVYQPVTSGVAPETGGSHVKSAYACHRRPVATPAELVSDDVAHTLHSEKVSVGRGDLWLSSRDNTTLRLVHLVDGHESAWNLVFNEQIDFDGDVVLWKQSLHHEWAETIRRGRIVDVALARFGNRDGLIAVAKVVSPNECTFWAFALSGDTQRLKPRVTIRTPIAFLASGQMADEIIAVSGNQRGAIVTVVIGSTSFGTGMIDAGMIIRDGCPFPLPTHVTVSRFKATVEKAAIPESGDGQRRTK